MFYSINGSRLIEEPSRHVVVMSELGMEYLDRYPTFDRVVNRFKYDTHSPFAELADDPVRSDRFRRHIYAPTAFYFVLRGRCKYGTWRLSRFHVSTSQHRNSRPMPEAILAWNRL